MDDIEVPQYFICPISLQIMKDPVTAITGITYDRESIEHWLFTSKNTTCPVSKQPLPKESGLTPNHTLRRLIQAWCTQNASHGIDRIPTPKPPLDRFQVLKLIKHLSQPHQLQLKTVRQLEFLAAGSERNRNPMVEAGVPKAMLLFIATCFKNGQINGIEEALSVLNFIPIPSAELKQLLAENDHIIDSLTWVLCCEMENHPTVKSHAMIVLKAIVKPGSSSVLLETLKPEFFKAIVRGLRSGITQEGINAALHVLLEASPWGRNRIMMAEVGAVFELIELELGLPERRTTELILGILLHLCSCADGRAQFLSHVGGIAVVSNRIFRVSAAADDRAILILSMICKYSSGTSPVLEEMLKVGAVKKLWSLLQLDCAAYLKDKAREILRSYSKEWKDSPCYGVSQDLHI
ncbi:E3 ubiquitin-protein ligase PUB24-like [Alnus glutinosa]|uniref:E3 ubiquitin-protein ligase PUB24-like n=1 Tax=Alnus glutinosa TaxID=3517 RepID=UPI002D796D8B|nr:E3 ubiquitin-protein ligase PUB24-like [Alnus glutinosa]